MRPYFPSSVKGIRAEGKFSRLFFLHSAAWAFTGRSPGCYRVHYENGKQEEQNVAVHGCAIIFSKKYVKKFPNVFYPNTFLFHEEDFLYYRIKKEKLLSLYSPEIEIVHKEGGSLEKMFKKNKRKKLLFRTEEIIKSLLLLKNEMTKE